MTRFTSVRSQRAFIGFLMLGSAAPTASTYDFWGSNALTYTSALGGSVALGLAWVNPPVWDRRQVVLGASLMVTFGLRFVVFLIQGIRTFDDPVSLYFGSSALWIHGILFFVGCVYVRQWIEHRHGKLE